MTIPSTYCATVPGLGRRLHPDLLLAGRHLGRHGHPRQLQQLQQQRLPGLRHGRLRELRHQRLRRLRHLRHHRLHGARARRGGGGRGGAGGGARFHRLPRGGVADADLAAVEPPLLHDAAEPRVRDPVLHDGDRHHHPHRSVPAAQVLYYTKTQHSVKMSHFCVGFIYLRPK